MYINSTRLLTDHVIAERVFKETHAHGTLAFAYRQSIKLDKESRKPTGDQLKIVITAVLADGTGVGRSLFQCLCLVSLQYSF
jgi:hypothetical protein